MRKYSIKIFTVFLFILLTGLHISCRKLVSVDEPIDSITAEKMYNTEAQAEGALVGIYDAMIHGTNLSNAATAFTSSFAAGLATYAGGLSAGEFFTGSSNPDDYALATNRLTLTNNSYPSNFWNSGYKVIYNANSVIEGIAGSKATMMRDSVRIQYTAEAKFLRAFSYFYLVNFFGDVPLALTVDFNKTVNVSRSPVSVVYAQILKDLEEAERDLPDTYDAGKGSSFQVRLNLAVSGPKPKSD